MIRYISLFISNIILLTLIYFTYINFDNGKVLGDRIFNKYRLLTYPGISIYPYIKNKKILINDDILGYLKELYPSYENLIYIYYGSIKLSTFLIFIYLGFLSFSIFNYYIYFLICIFLAFLIPKYLDEDIKIRYGEREKEIIDDLLIYLTRISILIESGMTIRDAFNETKDIRDSDFFFILRNAQTKMENGINYKEAIIYIYGRARLDYVKNLTTILIQGIDKGTNLTYQLKELRDDIKRERLINIRVKAGKISEKLLIPNIFIFIGIIIMILLPAFINL